MKLKYASFLILMIAVVHTYIHTYIHTYTHIHKLHLKHASLNNYDFHEGVYTELQ